MVDGLLFGKSLSSIISIATSDVANFSIISLIFVKDGWPEILTDVCANGLFIFFNKSFKNLYLGILRATVSALTP